MKFFTRTSIRSLAIVSALVALVALAAAGPGHAQERQASESTAIASLAESDPVQEAVARSAKQFAISIDDLYYCYGFDEDTHSCQLYLGSRQSCESLTPCFSPADAPSRERFVSSILEFPPTDDLHFCKGFNEVTNRCETYLGSAEACASLPGCL